MKDQYSVIDKALQRHEQGKYITHSIDWCINRIEWAYKWRHITKEQEEELAQRVCAILDNELVRITEGRKPNVPD